MPSISIQAVAATMKTWKAGSCFLLAIAAFGVQRTSATPCAAYDGTGSVAYVFGAPYGDLSLGTDLLDPSAFVSLTNKTGRPDFTGSNTQCFVNQFTNGLYVVGATNNSTDSVYIYDFVSQSWSTQRISGELDPTSYTAILDHDTNVLYAFGNGSISALAFNQEKATATSDMIDWQVDAARNALPFDGNLTYQPVMGAANNHIQFLNTPGASAAEAYIFVIHYAYWQPEAQSFGSLPNAHGQTVTILSNSSAAPATFAFIPDTGNGTYVVNAKSNVTQTYPGPPTSDASARYGASTTSLLQVTADGSLAYFDFTSGNQTWTSVDLSAFNQTTANTGTPGNASTTAAATTTATAVGPNNAAPSTRSESGAPTLAVPVFAIVAFALCAVQAIAS